MKAPDRRQAKPRRPRSTPEECSCPTAPRRAAPGCLPSRNLPTPRAAIHRLQSSPPPAFPRPARDRSDRAWRKDARCRRSRGCSSAPHSSLAPRHGCRFQSRNASCWSLPGHARSSASAASAAPAASGNGKESAPPARSGRAAPPAGGRPVGALQESFPAIVWALPPRKKRRGTKSLAKCAIRSEGTISVLDMEVFAWAGCTRIMNVSVSPLRVA